MLDADAETHVVTVSAVDREFRHTRELIDEHISSLRREMTLVAEYNKAAVEKAEAAQNKRLDQMNEMRDQIREERIAYASQEMVVTLGERVGRLEKFMWGLAGAFLLLQILARFIPSTVPISAIIPSNHEQTEPMR